MFFSRTSVGGAALLLTCPGLLSHDTSAQVMVCQTPQFWCTFAGWHPNNIPCHCDLVNGYTINPYAPPWRIVPPSGSPEMVQQPPSMDKTLPPHPDNLPREQPRP